MSLRISWFIVVLVTQSAGLTVSVPDPISPDQRTTSSWQKAANEPSHYTAVVHSLSAATSDVPFAVSSGGQLSWNVDLQIPVKFPTGSYVLLAYDGSGNRFATSNTFKVDSSAGAVASASAGASAGSGGSANAGASAGDGGSEASASAGGSGASAAANAQIGTSSSASQTSKTLSANSTPPTSLSLTQPPPGSGATGVPSTDAESSPPSTSSPSSDNPLFSLTSTLPFPSTSLSTNSTVSNSTIPLVAGLASGAVFVSLLSLSIILICFRRRKHRSMAYTRAQPYFSHSVPVTQLREAKNVENSTYNPTSIHTVVQPGRLEKGPQRSESTLISSEQRRDVEVLPSYPGTATSVSGPAGPPPYPPNDLAFLSARARMERTRSAPTMRSPVA